MALPTSSVLVRAAEASHLVTPEQLHHAVVTACDAGDELTVAARDVSDEAIGHRLVELGFLNAWQVEQLKEGRSKFSLGPYRILDAIGRGGMGHVFKAEHEMLGRVEAIKVLPRNKANAETIAKFCHEIRTQAQLDHPNLVRLHFADHHGDTYYFVSEFVPGADLRKLVRRLGPLTCGAAALILLQAAEGLEHAHRQGLVHRDIKPGNLLVTPGGVTKLIDLGLAWYLESDIHAAKQGDRLKIVGTADYLAPETIRDPGRIVPVSDVYSLGCTLYYAVTGKVPFPGGNPAEKMQRHVRETPLAPDQLQPNLPKGFVQLIAEMMVKDPNKRLPSAAVVAERIRAWASESAIAEISLAIERMEREQEDETPQPLSDSPHIEDTMDFDSEDETFDRLLKSPSEALQRTDPIDAASLDTSPHATPAFIRATADESQSLAPKGDRLVLASAVLAIAVVVGVLGALLWGSLGP